MAIQCGVWIRTSSVITDAVAMLETPSPPPCGRTLWLVWGPRAHWRVSMRQCPSPQGTGHKQSSSTVWSEGCGNNFVQSGWMKCGEINKQLGAQKVIEMHFYSIKAWYSGEVVIQRSDTRMDTGFRFWEKGALLFIKIPLGNIHYNTKLLCLWKISLLTMSSMCFLHAKRA